MESMLSVSRKNLFNSTSSKVDILVNITADDYIDVSYHWFHNAISFPVKTTFQPQQVKLTIDNPSLLNDPGVYETQLRTTIYSKLTCDNPSPYTGFMGTSTVIIRSDIQQLLYYGNLVKYA